jgi:hypothetical protein
MFIGMIMAVLKRESKGRFPASLLRLHLREREVNGEQPAQKSSGLYNAIKERRSRIHSDA